MECKKIDGKIYGFLVNWLGEKAGTIVWSFIKTLVATFVAFFLAELAVFFANPVWEINAILSVLYAVLVATFTAIIRTSFNWITGRYNFDKAEK